jgi:predicted nucleic acid-binding protein
LEAIRSGSFMSGGGASMRARLNSVSVGVIDAGIAIAWIRGALRDRKALDRLYTACRDGSVSLVMSTVNLAEVLIHTAKYAHASGVDPGAFLTASGLRIHPPDEAIARRVAKLKTSLADGFAAATAQELGARLHTTDGELVRQLRRVRLAVTYY